MITAPIRILPPTPGARPGWKPPAWLTRKSLVDGPHGLTLGGATLAFPHSFPTFANLSALLRSLALDGVMACGMVVLMVGGMFDFSIGSMFSMIGVLTAWMMTAGGLPPWVAVPAGLVLAALGGALNGLVVAKVSVNALIATLGTMQVYRGIAVLVGGPGISNLPPAFAHLGQAGWLGLQTPVWLMLAVAAAGQWLLSKTRFFRRYYYIGANARAAPCPAFRSNRMLIAAFALMGLLGGFGGNDLCGPRGHGLFRRWRRRRVAHHHRRYSGWRKSHGGRGTVWGALLGVLFISLINNVMIFARLSPEWQSIVIGGVLILAVAMDHFLRRGRKK